MLNLSNPVGEVKNQVEMKPSQVMHLSNRFRKTHILDESFYYIKILQLITKCIGDEFLTS